jgi:NAD(P)-dependent dehydrogenase (short-subunit alcohol dehydrogenase family)
MGVGVEGNQLEGGVAVVTGGGRGVGRAAALAFAAAGAAVLVTARSTDEIAETAALITAAGGRAAFFAADVTNLESLREMLAFTETELGVPSLLMNNAGGGEPGSSGRFETLEPEAIVAGLQINLISTMLLTRLVLPGMLERGSGCIINVASGAGMLAMPFLAPYNVGKTGIVRFSEALAMELEGRGVAVFSMTPGNVLTKLTAPLWPGRAEFIASPPDGAPWIFPPGHAMEDHGWYPPERAAELCLFLASGAADALSGRFFSVHYDEREITAQADRVEREQLYTLRIPTLNGIEEPIVYGDHGPAHRVGAVS